MKMTSDQLGGVTVIRPQGAITIGDGDVALREEIQNQLKDGHRKLVLDMKGVRYVDSAGLGELVASLKRVREAGGNLKVVAVNQNVMDAFTLTKLIQIFDMYDTESAAIASFV